MQAKTKRELIPALIHNDVCEVVFASCAVLSRLEDGGDIIRQGAAFGDLKNDTEIRADRILGEHLLERFRQPRFGAGLVTVEGFGDYPGMLDDFYNLGLWYCIDPLDGSLNYKLEQDLFGARDALPYSLCVTVLRTNCYPKFKDVVVAAVMDLRTGDLWSASTVLDGERPVTGLAYFNRQSLWRYDTYHQGQERQELRLDLGSQLIIGEMYYPENREKLCRIFAEEKGYLRSFGSAAFEMALVASGTAAAYICDRQKNHELGAAYALVKGAGGVAVDFDGNDLGERTYRFDEQTPVVLAANRGIAEEILERMHRAS